MPVPLVLDLIAAVLAGGAAPAGAVRAVGESLRAAGDVSGEQLLALAVHRSGGTQAGRAASSRGQGGLDALWQALELATATGLGPVALVRAAAQDERRRSAAAQIRSARRLGVLVVLPTGLCLLPAFILLTVVPLVLDLVLG